LAFYFFATFKRTGPVVTADDNIESLEPFSAPASVAVIGKMRWGFQSIGIPCYTSNEDAVYALAAVCRYQKYLNVTQADR
jgi:acyl-CoA synthetase (NDP forming)